MKDLEGLQISVWPGSALFAYRMYFLNFNEIETDYPVTLIFKMDLPNSQGREIT